MAIVNKKIPLESLDDMKVKTYKCLKEFGINDLRDIQNYTKEEIKNIPMFGPTSFSNLKYYMDKYNISFRKVIDTSRYEFLEGFELMQAYIEDDRYKNPVTEIIDTKTRTDYKHEETNIFDLFQMDLYKAYGIENNPKRSKCFRLAWEYGHSSGYYEVLNHFDELVDLIK